MERNLTHRFGPASAIFVLIIAVVVLFAGPAAAQSRVVTVSDESKHAGEFVVPLNKSQILRLDVPFADLLVGNAEIADVLALTDRSIYVLGKTMGSTSLTIYGRNRTLIAVADLVVTHDIDGLKARLFELMPDENIEVRPLNTSIVLSGTVSSATRLERARMVAEQYTGSEGAVTNLMSVKGSQQVMLAVRFSEVSRDASKELGINGSFLADDFLIAWGDSLSQGFNLDVNNGSFSAANPAVALSGFGAGAGVIDLGSSALGLAFDALEDKGLSKTLAEPNLIALSGETASFLAGGEFPIPVAQQTANQETGQGGTITIEFKEFGVSLAFSPTVLDDGLINLIVSPEVSALDFSLAAEGVPALTTRRATTTVELRDGQSFAIAGLLQEDFTDNIEQFPGLGDLPVLGALFRSTEYQRKETELVILVTPHLVQPAPAGSLAAPSDNFVPPSDLDLFLHGRLEDPESGIGPLGVGGGGIDGSYGHIIK
jgi:pilus assembly protein CpaC